MRQLHIRFPHGWKIISNFQLTKDRQNELAAYWLYNGCSVKFTPEVSPKQLTTYQTASV